MRQIDLSSAAHRRPAVYSYKLTNSRIRQAPVAVVQARSSSHRLPNKVLTDVCGRPLLAYVLERLRHCDTLQDVIIATSLQSDDDAIAALGAQLGVRVHRGSLDDVLSRFIDAARWLRVANVVRISGDSPLIDPAIVDQVVECFFGNACDLATNVFPRSFPKGQSAEVVSVASLERVASSTDDPVDREHVTRYMYRHPEAFAIRNVRADRNLSDIQLSVDRPEDLALTTRIITSMNGPHWQHGLEEILAIRESLLKDQAGAAGTTG